MNDDRELADLRTDLLDRLRVPATTGEEAFERHQLLAIRVHRAARLAQAGGERASWIAYVTTHFPAPRNVKDDAQRLFEYWRNPLVKDEMPGSKIAITHGQPFLHWQRDADDVLCIDLESMCDDFEHSVDDFLAALKRDPVARVDVLGRWRTRGWTVRQFAAGLGAAQSVTGYSTSATVGTSIVQHVTVPLPSKPKPRPPKDDAA
jgi:hypothetical protein